MVGCRFPSCGCCWGQTCQPAARVRHAWDALQPEHVVVGGRKSANSCLASWLLNSWRSSENKVCIPLRSIELDKLMAGPGPVKSQQLELLLKAAVPGSTGRSRRARGATQEGGERGQRGKACTRIITKSKFPSLCPFPPTGAGYRPQCRHPGQAPWKGRDGRF